MGEGGASGGGTPSSAAGRGCAGRGHAEVEGMKCTEPLTGKSGRVRQGEGDVGTL